MKELAEFILILTSVILLFINAVTSSGKKSGIVWGVLCLVEYFGAVFYLYKNFY